ncbi:MAG TPA: hypothetical protein VG433_15410, partial [Pirellulales bacterium]|nr:hypothetical protein [Pirellulales bacterium]
FLNFPQFTDPQIQKAVEEAMAANPFPPAVQVGMPLVGGLVMLIAGIAMLRGRGWGRWLFTVYFVLGLGIALAISHMKLLLIPGAMPQILLIYFMFRPVANAYFSPSEVVSSA